MKMALLCILFSCVSFFAGYLFATATDDTVLGSQSLPNGTHTGNNTVVSISDKYLSSHADPERLAGNNSVELQASSSAQSEMEELKTSDLGLDSMLIALQELRERGRDSAEVAAQFDRIRNLISVHQDIADSAISLLNEYPADSKTFGLLLAAVQGSSNEHIESSLLLLAEQYGMSSDPLNQEKFITLLASTHSEIKTPTLIDSLYVLVNDQQADLKYRLEALSHLQPDSVSQTDKSTIVSTLMSDIRFSNSEQAERLLPYLMRFSEREQRSDLIVTMLSDLYSENVHIAVMENINSGYIDKNEQISALLRKIADNSTGQMNVLAIEALAHSRY